MTTTIRARPRPRAAAVTSGTASGRRRRLAAGHRDVAVDEDLVGDVAPAATAGAPRGARVEEGAVAEVLEDVLLRGERRLTDPEHALAAHVRDGAGARSHPHRHAVAADAADRRASPRAPRSTCCAGSPSRSSASRDRARRRRRCRRARGGELGHRRSARPSDAATTRGDDLAGRAGRAGAPPGCRACRRRHRARGGRVVEQAPSPAPRGRALLLDDEDALEPLGEAPGPRGSSGHVMPTLRRRDRARGERVVDAELASASRTSR